MSLRNLISKITKISSQAIQDSKQKTKSLLASFNKTNSSLNNHNNSNPSDLTVIFG